MRLRLDVKLEEKGESFYNPIIPAVIKELEDQKIVELSDGAKCIFNSKFPVIFWIVLISVKRDWPRL